MLMPPFFFILIAGEKTSLFNQTKKDRIKTVRTAINREDAMPLSTSEAIESDKTLQPLVSRANQFFIQVIGPRADSADIQWSIVPGARDRASVLLVLSDSTGARVETRFTPDDLAKENHLQAKLYRIWGDLLQARSHQLLRQLTGQ